MILKMCGGSFIFRATEPDMLTNIKGAQLHTKYSDFTSFEDVFLKENFDSIQTSDTFKLIKWYEDTHKCGSPEAGHKEDFEYSYETAR